ncbi:type II toxin-antitoxin system Phd/YefM family antitoxin [Pseudomonas sp. hsmgli-8]|uniref:Type II toxin-antitoxin system Phd/YefM family antitoxin n=2 Tax=Pseudomonas TaxID=286 RepID=A0ABX0YE52_9PSED|nr:type II toxin-antitoxin system Phd/YefM family antitoxin [Pseudomonas sp. LY10J]NJP01693.1 type II toxin-antitoxin system Phd/YefM family antitoxin [Pseudomonas quercus]
MAQSFSARLKDITDGDVTHLVIFNDNEPPAVLVGVNTYQALQDELEDLRSELLAIERLRSFDEANTLTLEDMEAQLCSGAHGQGER